MFNKLTQDEKNKIINARFTNDYFSGKLGEMGGEGFAAQRRSEFVYDVINAFHSGEIFMVGRKNKMVDTNEVEMLDHDEQAQLFSRMVKRYAENKYRTRRQMVNGVFRSVTRVGDNALDGSVDADEAKSAQQSAFDSESVRRSKKDELRAAIRSQISEKLNAPSNGRYMNPNWKAAFVIIIDDLFNPDPNTGRGENGCFFARENGNIKLGSVALNRGSELTGYCSKVVGERFMEFIREALVDFATR